MANKVKIFVSYAHEDRAHLTKLERHLTPLLRQGFIDLWHDRNISAGANWQHEIDQHLDTAHIILLLVSPDFISSDYCHSVEVTRAKERHERGEAILIPIILRPIQWQQEFGTFEALPTGTKPVTKWSNRDEAFLDVTLGIQRVVEELNAKSSASLSPSKLIESQRAISVMPESTQEGSYTQSWNRQRRGLLVLLLDQSEEMNETTMWQGYELTLIQMATAIVNNMLLTIVENASFDPQTGRRRDICDIAIFGYGDGVRPLLNSTNLSISLPDLAEDPRGQHTVRVSKYDPFKGYITVDEKQPFWIEPSVNGRREEMNLAISAAHQAVQNWFDADASRHFSFPPLIINVTGGRHKGMSNSNPAQAVTKLRQLRTDDGAALFFNCYITQSNAQSLSFPQTIEQIKNLQLQKEERLIAERLFEISSPVPDTMRTRAQQVFARIVPPGARGFIYNGGGQALINFLSWGTQLQRAYFGIWPTVDEYDTALINAPVSVYDADIRGAKLLHDSRPLRMNGQSGNYVSVYKMGDWVVKCFFTNIVDMLVDNLTIAPPPDIRERYRAIGDYIGQHIQQLPFLVPQLWIEKGISINRQDWPFIKATFIKAATLGMFLEDMHHEPTAVAALAEQWLAITTTLEALNMAHGDLNITNVLVSGTYPHVVLRLVDFDSMYVPTLNGRTLYELGDENFQPSHPGVRRFNSEMDRFSALVIYLSLIALVEDARLWEQCKADEDTKLLLGANDFRDLQNSPAYNLLRAKRANQQLQQCLDELERSIREQRMARSLSDLLQVKQAIGQPPLNDQSIQLPINSLTQDLSS